MTEKELGLPEGFFQMYEALAPEEQRQLLSQLKARIKRAQFVVIAGGKKDPEGG